MSLADLGLQSLSLTGLLTDDARKPNDNVIYATTEAVLSDGRTIVAGDVILAFHTREESAGRVGDEVAVGLWPIPSGVEDLLAEAAARFTF